MNYALIIAGGSGNRMGQDIPKQFMHVDNCPIIIHTMMAFQKHPDIQGIAVVCLAGWETVLQSYANQFCITKLKWIFPGGSNGQESIHNGIYGLKEMGCVDDDLVWCMMPCAHSCRKTSSHPISPSAKSMVMPLRVSNVERLSWRVRMVSRLIQVFLVIS